VPGAVATTWRFLKRLKLEEKQLQSWQAGPLHAVLNDGYEPTVPGESVGFQVTGGDAQITSPEHQLRA